MSLLSEVVIPVMPDLGLRYFRHPETDNALVTLLPLQEYTPSMAVVLVAQLGDYSLSAWASICQVPQGRSSAFAGVIDQLNGRAEFVTWRVEDDMVFATHRLIAEVRREWRRVVAAVQDLLGDDGVAQP